jgi:predicted transcriptional regulator
MKTVKNKLTKLKADWFDKLNKEQQKDILAGLGEADRGETVPHADVVKQFRKYGLK